MWGSKGRSGYGDSTIGGDYDSWDGVSPNGKQYKNEATMETRNLSGADYWHLRKQNRPTEAIPVELHMLKSGKANIDAYSILDEPKKSGSKVSVKDKILPQFKRLQTLRTQMMDLEQEYKNTNMTCAEYSMLRDVIVVKIARAEVLYQRAISVRPKVQEEEPESRPFFGDSSYFSRPTPTSESVPSLDINAPKDTTIPVWIDELSSENSLKKPLKIACKVVRKVLQLSQASKRYIQTLKEV